MRSKLEECNLFGIDIGKTLFHICGCNPQGKPVFRKKLKRGEVLEFFANRQQSRIGMEACPGSQWLARKLIAQGHDAKIMSGQFVKPYLKNQKNDANDAEAIAEALQRPTMRFVAVKSIDQTDTQALHRVRDRLVRQHTQLINQTRALCLEYGVPLASGPAHFYRDFPSILEDAGNDLSPGMRRIVARQWAELLELKRRLGDINKEVKALAARDDVARRLMTIPGIGELGATALVSAIADPKAFRKGRDLAAWIGLVPRQFSTGGKSKLLGITKRGNPYLRRLLIHGARTARMHLNRDRDRLGPWLTNAEERMHGNKVTVAFANKIARIAWVILTTPGATYQKEAAASM